MVWALLGLPGSWISSQCGWELTIFIATPVWVLQLLQRLCKKNYIFLPVTLLASCHPWLSITYPLAPLPHSFLLSFMPGLELIPSLPGVGGPTHPHFSDAILLLVVRVSARC